VAGAALPGEQLGAVRRVLRMSVGYEADEGQS